MKSSSGKPLSAQQLKSMRALAHQLKPVVTIAQNGLSESVSRELDQTLERHELIKVKIAVGDRELRQQLNDEICRQTGAQCVQSVGNVAVFYRAAVKPDPRLSNLLRFASS